LIENALTAGTAKYMLTAFLATSGLLHFYYDGFIWKMRESSNRESLGLQTNTKLTINVPSLMHALKWAAFMMPVAWLTIAEIHFEPNVSTRWIQLSRSFPNSEFVQNQTAEILEKEDRLIEATRYLANTIEINPDNLDARLRLATVLKRRDRNSAALGQLAAILELDETHTAARILASRILASNGQFEHAAAQLRRALASAPKSIDARINLGIVLGMSGKLDESAAEFRQVLASHDDADAHYNLAHVLVRQGHPVEAKQHFTKAFQLKPELRSQGRTDNAFASSLPTP
jgi:tetratricopeptide (TPR) repeat protein